MELMQAEISQNSTALQAQWKVFGAILDLAHTPREMLVEHSHSYHGPADAQRRALNGSWTWGLLPMARAH